MSDILVEQDNSNIPLCSSPVRISIPPQPQLAAPASKPDLSPVLPKSKIPQKSRPNVGIRSSKIPRKSSRKNAGVPPTRFGQVKPEVKTE